MLKNLYARWMYSWETRLTTRDENRVVRPLGSAASLVECRLKTGRTHQIRVHLTELGHSLIGDKVYGKPRTARAKALDPDAGAALLGFVGWAALVSRITGTRWRRSLRLMMRQRS